MRKTRLCLLVIFVTFSHTNGMIQKLKMQEQKNKVGHRGKEKFWLITDDEQRIDLTITQAKKNALLNYYIQYFGYANSKKSPLKIGSKKVLDALSSVKINDFLSANKKTNDESLAYALEIYHCLQNTDVDHYIMQLLLRLNGYSTVPFLFNHIFYHNGGLDNNYHKKVFFHNKKFYWQKSRGGLPIFYDHDCNEVFKVTYEDHVMNLSNGEYFIPAYKDNVILMVRDCQEGIVLILYNLATKEKAEIAGNFSNFEISPDAHYVAVCHSGHNTIEVYDITQMNNIHIVATVKHMHMRDFIFSPCGSKLISWSNRNQDKDKIILWNLKDIQNVTATTVFSNIECTQVIFNADSEYICVIDSKEDTYEGTTNTIHNGSGIILNSSNPREKVELSFWNTAHVFSEDSDLIMCKNDSYIPRRTTTRIFTKTGQIELPKGIEHCSCSLNKEYILAQDRSGVYLFDHSMKCIMQLICASIGMELKLDKENAIIGEKYDDRSQTKNIYYWPLPDKKSMQIWESITREMTTAQLKFLELLGTESRGLKTHLILRENTIPAKIFQTFKPEQQTFLKKQFFITQQEASS